MYQKITENDRGMCPIRNCYSNFFLYCIYFVRINKYKEYSGLARVAHLLRSGFLRPRRRNPAVRGCVTLPNLEYLVEKLYFDRHPLFVGFFRF